MSPKLFIEVLRLTYDFEYAREVGARMVRAAYPHASPDDRNALAAMVIQGCLLSEQTSSGIACWTLDDIQLFLHEFDQVLLKHSPSLMSYLKVEGALKQVAARAFALTEELPDTAPCWFKQQFYQPAWALCHG